MVLWKQTTAFIFVLLELSSCLSRRRKGCFKYFLGLNCSLRSQERTHLYCCCVLFFLQKHCQNLTAYVLCYTANDPVLLVLPIEVKIHVQIIQKFEALQLHQYSWSCNALTNSLYRKLKICFGIMATNTNSNPSKWAANSILLKIELA